MTTPRACAECKTNTPHVYCVGDESWVYTCTKCGAQHGLDIGEPRIAEVEPGLWELRITHGGHEHALRARDGFARVNGVDEPRTAQEQLADCARFTKAFIADGRMKCEQA